MDSPSFKAGFVAIMGRPNSGKSTLLNALLKAKLSIVSPKPQTTRHKILGILDGEGFQLCLLDTPGLLSQAKDPLQGALQRASRAAAHDDADILVLLVEPGLPSGEELDGLSWLARPGVPLLLVLNKIDLPAKSEVHDRTLEAYAHALKPSETFKVSALKGEGVPSLLDKMRSLLPAAEGPFYEPGRLSDRWERFFASEIVREQVFSLYAEEIPHATAVVIESFRDGPKGSEVAALLYVERDGQKGILIGKNGRALRELLERSRASLQDFLGRPVELEAWVKVRKDWRKDPRSLKEFGYLP